MVGSCAFAVQPVGFALEDPIEFAIAVDDAAGGGLLDAHDAPGLGSGDVLFLHQLNEPESHLNELWSTSLVYLL